MVEHLEWVLVSDTSVVRVTRPVLIGRASSCDLVIADPSASRHHAEVRPTPRGPVIEDTGSRHGTLVNGERIHAPVLLRHADRVLIGGQLVMVRDSSRYRRELADTTEARTRLRAEEAKQETGEIDPVATSLAELEHQANVSLAVVASLLDVAAKRPQLDGEIVRRLSMVALKAASNTPSSASDVTDAVVRLHAALGLAMHATVLDALTVAVSRGVELDRVLLLAYVAQIESAAAPASVERLRRIATA